MIEHLRRRHPRVIFEMMWRTSEKEIIKLEAKVQQLRAGLKAASICFKNRDTDPQEAAVYAVISKLLEEDQP